MVVDDVSNSAWKITKTCAATQFMDIPTKYPYPMMKQDR
jgi:hypothetical protein